MTMLQRCSALIAGFSVTFAAATSAQELMAPESVAPVDDGLITIESDSQSADNVTGVVTAIGNVRIVYPTRGMVATSRQAQYFSREGRLVLSGDVDVVQDDGNSIRAERVTYDLNDERALAMPSNATFGCVVMEAGMLLMGMPLNDRLSCHKPRRAGIAQGRSI